MTWHAQLNIAYVCENQRTVARHAHTGPLRVLQSLYPEGDGVCHNVLVHPPGGLVGGDRLDIDVTLQGAAHALITTPGATRFYRSAGDWARQHTHITLTDQARLEWLPMEALCYNQCLAENKLTMDLAPQASIMGWDITALGLPHAALPFEHGSFLQHLEVPGVWLERGRIDAHDSRLMNGRLGLAGMRCMASLFWVSGSAIDRGMRETGLDLARELMATHDLRGSAGATCPNPQVMVVRVLAPVVEPAMHLLRQIRTAWRSHFWQLSASMPRIWST